MSKKELLIKEIKKAPDDLVGEMLDFLGYLRLKRIQELGATALASEDTLKKDWLRPEEDKAWAKL